jgi:beta-glucosidase
MPGRAGTTHFPADFVWGTATAAYQIEGATSEDGRGRSIWDTFSEEPGRVRNGETGAVADDHYHRFREDVALMRDLGVNGYRFSIAWPRVLPSGEGTVNELGLSFYDALVDALLEAGIQPFVTLYHWDLPQALEDRGGWLSRDTADAFASYAEIVARRLGDRVKHWITLNEPQVAAFAGYASGDHAPGLREGDAGGIRAAHHLLLAHGSAVEAIRQARPDARVGITLNLTPVHPASDAESDRVIARRQDVRQNRLFLDPLFRGRYADETRGAFGEIAPPVEAGDLSVISRPIDFLGVNYYSRSVVRAGPEGKTEHIRPRGSRFTEMGWEVYPDGLRELLIRLQRDYSPPRMYVTENGAAFSDVRLHDGSVRDPERREYINAHIDAIERALIEGADVRGYFVWSLLDNFEWAHGYSKRFGIVFVDYPTLERVPKESARWFAEFVRRQRGIEP